MERDRKRELQELAEDFTASSPLNYVSGDAALRPDLEGMCMFAAPVVGVASAEDPLFDRLRDPEVIGPHFLPPDRWLAGARSVVSVFLPITQQVCRANAESGDGPAPEWLHARIEGQQFVVALTRRLAAYCEEMGYAALIPPQDGRFTAGSKPGEPGPGGNAPEPGFTSNWSERHVAHVCGLGTFCLSRHLITSRGAAGRFGSFVTDMPLEPDGRPYTAYDEYCTHCGACIARCPVGAITEAGKDQRLCGAYLDAVARRHSPRYGCGKCSVGVPCQSGPPAKSGEGGDGPWAR